MSNKKNKSGPQKSILHSSLPFTRKSLRILVGKAWSNSLHNCSRREILGRNKLQAPELSIFLLCDDGSDLWINFAKTIVRKRDFIA